MAICLPGIASSAKRAPTSATRSDPLAMTMNWIDRQHEEDDRADDVVAADDERAERPDDLARVGLEQDEPRRRDVEREPKERRQEKERGKRRDADRVRHVEDDEEDGDGGRQVRRDEEVEHPRRQRHDHQPERRDHEGREHNVRRGKPAARASVRRQGRGAVVHAADRNAARSWRRRAIDRAAA